MNSYSSSYGLKNFGWAHWARNYSTAPGRVAGRVEGADVQSHSLECAATQSGTFVMSWAKIHDHRQTLARICRQVPSSKTARRS